MSGLLEIWDKRDRLIVLVSFASAALALAQFPVIAAILAYIAVALCIWILITSETLNIKQYWRSLPLYVVNIVAAVIYGIHAHYSGNGDERGHNGSSDIISHAWSAILTIAIVQFIFGVLAAICLYAFALPSAIYLPGKHKLIGTTSLAIPLDHKTKERHPSLKEFDRYNDTVPVQIWFPMQDHSNWWMRVYERYFKPRALLWTSGHPTLQGEESRLLIQEMTRICKLPHLTSCHMSLSRVNAMWQDDLSRLCPPERLHGKYPIAIHSHGMYGWRQLNSSVCEALASQGYIVFSCDHYPDCVYTRFPDKPSSEWKPFDFNKPTSGDDSEERAFYFTGMHRRINDLKEIIDWAVDGAMANKFPQVKDLIDNERICVWGFSFGGGAVTALSCLDNRIDKMIALDGWMYPIPELIRTNGIQSASVLNLSAKEWPFGSYQIPFRKDCISNSNKNPRPIYDMFVQGADHQNFCESYLLASKHLMRKSTVLGKGVEPRPMMYALERIIPAFFSCEDFNSGKSVGYVSPASTTAVTRTANPADSVEVTSDIEIKIKESNSSDEPTASRVHHAKELLLHLSAISEKDSKYHKTLQLCKATSWFVENHVVHESTLPDLANYAAFHKYNPPPSTEA